jgi:CRISPR/Cas system endoribonuclease Cas6 (RAMP superfamily)
MVPDIIFIKLKLYLTAKDPIYLPPFSGSVFRGSFGAAFRRTCCVTHQKHCSHCMMKTSCVYARIFETADGHVAPTGYKLHDYPRPFIIEPPFLRNNHYKKGDTLHCHLILMGKAIEYLPYFVFAFSEMGRFGIGSSRGTYDISKITCLIGETERTVFEGSSQSFIDNPVTMSLRQNISLPPECRELSLTFITPTRIKSENRLTKALDFQMLMHNLLRRLTLLNHVCSKDTSWTIDYKGLIQKAAEKVQCKTSHLLWYDWQRYSSRQKSAMKLGGFLGTISFEGQLHDFLPYIQAGEYVHIGKACTFGLGKYETSRDHQSC